MLFSEVFFKIGREAFHSNWLTTAPRTENRSRYEPRRESGSTLNLDS